ncbi:MAG: hypothetical protein WAW88_14630 [Nocardioides sp.]
MSTMTSAALPDPHAGEGLPAGSEPAKPARRLRLQAVAPVWVPAPRFPFVTLVSMIMVGGIVGLLMFNTSMQQASFAATELEQQARTLAQREQTLQMELQELRDPQLVAERARGMGMVPMRHPAFLRLADGSFSGDLTPATAEDGLDIAAPGYRPPPAAFWQPPAPEPQAVTKSNKAKNRSGDTAAGSPNSGTTQGRN